MNNIKWINILAIILIISTPILSQKRARSDYKNELYVSTYFFPYIFNPYSLGYERTLMKNRNSFLSSQNEYSTTIASTHGTDGNRLQSLIKWNMQRNNIISFGIGLSYRLNNPSERLNYVANTSFKYDFRKYKMTFTGSTLILVAHFKPTAPVLGNLTCVTNCPNWGYIWRFSISLGKYF